MNHLADDILNEYLDDALSISSRTEVEIHLAACPDCAASLAEYRTLFASLASLPDLALEIDLSPIVLSRLPQAERLPPSIRWISVAQVVSSLVALAALWPQVHATFLSAFLSAARVSLPLPSLIGYMALVQSVSRFHLPTFSFNIPSLAMDIPPATITVALLSILFLWLAGNGFLLIPRSRR